MQFLQHDEPRQVLGWRTETTTIQRYAVRQGIVCDMRRNLLQEFVPKGERLSPVCFHHADIVSSCISFEPTTPESNLEVLPARRYQVYMDR